jgi:hypothetical protein
MKLYNLLKIYKLSMIISFFLIKIINKVLNINKNKLLEFKRFKINEIDLLF